MTRFVVDHAICFCDQGRTTAMLKAPTKCRPITIGGAPSFAATTNNTTFYGTFGVCTILSAMKGQAAAFANTPCVPVPEGLWRPGGSGIYFEDGMALVDSDKLKCVVGGMISIQNAGQGGTEYVRQGGPQWKPLTDEEAIAIALTKVRSNDEYQEMKRPWWRSLTDEERLRLATGRELHGGERGAVSKELDALDRDLDVKIRKVKEAIEKGAGAAARLAEERARIGDLQRQQAEMRADRERLRDLERRQNAVRADRARVQARARTRK